MPDPPPRTRAGRDGCSTSAGTANRRAMAWIAGYLRAYAGDCGTALGGDLPDGLVRVECAPSWLPGPTVLFTLVGLLCIAVSSTGNEAAERLRPRARRAVAMLGGAGYRRTPASPPIRAAVVVGCVFAWNAAIYLDSSALTAGTVQAADPTLRGATMGLHSMAGYAGGFVGPLAIGVVLDAAGRRRSAGPRLRPCRAGGAGGLRRAAVVRPPGLTRHGLGVRPSRKGERSAGVRPPGRRPGRPRPRRSRPRRRAGAAPAHRRRSAAPPASRPARSPPARARAPPGRPPAARPPRR